MPVHRPPLTARVTRSVGLGISLLVWLTTLHPAQATDIQPPRVPFTGTNQSLLRSGLRWSTATRAGRRDTLSRVGAQLGSPLASAGLASSGGVLISLSRVRDSQELAIEFSLRAGDRFERVRLTAESRQSLLQAMTQQADGLRSAATGLPAGTSRAAILKVSKEVEGLRSSFGKLLAADGGMDLPAFNRTVTTLSHLRSSLEAALKELRSLAGNDSQEQAAAFARTLTSLGEVTTVIELLTPLLQAISRGITRMQ